VEKNKLLFLFILVFSVGTFFITPLYSFQIKRVQNVTGTFSETDNTILATLGDSVDILNSFILLTADGGMFTSNFKDSKALNIIRSKGYLDTSRRVSVESYVVEFLGGVKIFRGEIGIDKDVLIKDILLPETIDTTKTFPLISVRGSVVSSDDVESQFFKATFPDRNTLRLKRLAMPQATYSTSLSPTYVVWQVVEIERDVSIRSGEVSIPYNSSKVTVSLGPNPLTKISKAFLVFNYTGGGEINGVEGLLMTRGTISDANTLTFSRAVNGRVAGQNIDIAWYVVEFTDLASNVQRGSATISSGTKSAKVKLDYPVDIERAFPIIYTSGGDTNLAKISDDLVKAEMTKTVTAGDTLKLTRRDSIVATDVNWFVVELAPLTVKAPANNEVWRVGETKNVQWSYASSLEKGGSSLTGHHMLDIFLSMDGGETFPFTIAKGIDATFNSYGWLIPAVMDTTNIIGDKLKVRVVDTDLERDNYDDSQGNFQIKGTISLAAPIGGEVWYVGDTNRDIIWHKTGNFNYSTFSIRLSENGGESYDTVVAEGLTQAEVCVVDRCRWRWEPAVIDRIGRDRRIKVLLASDPEGVYDASSENFYIKGRLYINSPNGGEEWGAQTIQRVAWHKEGTFNTVSLYYSQNSGESFDYIIGSEVPAGDTYGFYDWDIPPEAVSDFARIMVVSDQPEDLRAEDVSDGDFRVVPSTLRVTYPNSGEEVWRVGSRETITWEVYGTIEKVHCWYSKDGEDWVRITPPGGVEANKGENQGSFTWDNIPDIVSDEVYILVSKVDGDSAPGVPYDECDYPFSIKGRIELLAPEGGESWVVGSSAAIRWDTWGSIGNVRILFAPNGVDYKIPVTVKPQGIPASKKEFIWKYVPDSVTSMGKVRIELISDPTDVYDESPGYFSIRGSLKLVSPRGGEIFYVGDTTKVEWRAKGKIGSVELGYSLDGGETYPDSQIIISGLSQEASPYEWQVPDVISDKVRIKVAALSDEKVFDVSQSNFSIKGKLNLLAPNGGEVLGVGSLEEIKWERKGDIGEVKLEYSTDNGKDGYPYLIDSNISSRNLSYSWQIPDAVGNELKVRITLLSDNTTYDTSDGVFTIKERLVLLSPRQGEVWRVGEKKNITWNTFGEVDKVNLYYSVNDGESYDFEIVSSISNVEGYLWTVPDVIGKGVRLKVESYYDDTVYTTSDGFEIKGRVVVDSPNGGEVWRVGEGKNIKWVPYGSIGKVEIRYSRDGGVSYPDTYVVTPLGGIPSKEKSFLWVVPDEIGSNLKIKIVSLNDEDVNDESDGVFEIKGVLQLTEPNGGEVFYVGDTCDIKWKKQGSLGEIELRYSTDGGESFPSDQIIAKGVAADKLLYSWVVPDIIGEKVRVRVLFPPDPQEVYDDSNSDFSVKGKLHLNTPRGGEVWEVASYENIKWQRVGSIKTVELRYSTDGGVTYPNVIVPSTDATLGSYTWLVPDEIGSNLRVKVIDKDDDTVFDTSHNDFTVRGKIVIVSPIGGENLVVGSVFPVRWDTYGSIPKVNLYYSADSGINYRETIVTAFDNKGSYDWRVPDLIGSHIRVKVENYDNRAVFDTSKEDLAIKGSVTLVAPNGGEAWVVDDIENIIWKKTGTIGNVEIRYSTDGGESYPDSQVISPEGGVVSSGLTFSWRVPDKIGKNLKVRINSLDYPDVSDESDKEFIIKGSLTLLSPNGGEALKIGSVQDITWSKTGSVGDIEISYSDDGGVTYPYTIEKSVDANLGVYSWIILDNPTVRARVKIASINDATVFDTSDLNFRIKGLVTITAPNGGEVWVVGEKRNISWNIVGGIENVRIDYSTDGGRHFDKVVASSTSAASGFYTWVVPDDVSENVRLRVTDANDATVTDYSDGDLSIKPFVALVSPNGGEVLTVNSIYDVRWKLKGTISKVKLEYSLDGGETYPYIISPSTPAAALSYPWKVPDTIANTCMIRISDVSDSMVNDTSDAYFRIKGSLVLTSPNGGESFTVGSSHIITWARIGSIANVKLEYSTNGFRDEGETHLITSLLDSSLGRYSWLIPDTLSPNCKVRISDVSDSTVYDVSNNSFRIRGNLWLTAPKGGEVWIVGDAENITWDKVGSISEVEIRYSTDSGKTFPDGNIIALSIPASNLSYSWTIPDKIGDTLRIKIADRRDVTVSDESDDFAIKGKLNIISPNGGETWVVGESHNIIWERKGSTGNIKLEYSPDGFTDESQTKVINAFLPAADSRYNWVVPDAISARVKVRISDVSDRAIGDVSDGSFTIKGALQLTSPNGGEVLTVEESFPITWKVVGSIGEVRLEYSTDGGITYHNVIKEGLEASLGSYSWIVPDSIGKQLRVWISDTSDDTVFDYSDDDFEIKGGLNIITPNGGEVWQVGTMQKLQWETKGSIDNVRLEYSTNGFSDDSQIAVITPSTDAEGGYFVWKVADSISPTVKVRVVNSNDDSVYDISDNNFKIVGVLHLISPNGGERWEVGSKHQIRWERIGSINNVKIEYSSDRGNTYTPIVESTPAGTLNFSWSIPDALSQQVKVKISDASDRSVFDVSDSTFIIQGIFNIDTPDGGEVWKVGSSHDIKWETVGSVPRVRLDYSTDGGRTFPYLISASVPNTGVFPWVIPDTISSEVRVRVGDSTNRGAFDISDSNFKLRGDITLFSPNGGEAWVVEKSYDIKWSIEGSINYVKIEYSTDGGITYPYLIASDIEASIGRYSWRLPDTLSQRVRVKITDINDTIVYDTSDSDFKIRGSLRLVTPNGGEVWEVGSKKSISWKPTGSIDKVKLEYSSDGGVTYPYLIVSSTEAFPAVYEWSVPDTITTHARVKVSDTSDATVYDTSDNDFKIQGSLTITIPNGGEEWRVGSSEEITWDVVGSISDVTLTYSLDEGESFPYLIVSSSPCDGSYTWVVADSISDKVRVKIADANDLSVYDISDDNFKIVGKLALVIPNGGEVWPVDSPHDIVWEVIGSIGKVKLEYSLDGGVTYPYLIVQSTDASSLRYNWEVADAISSTVKIKITDALDSTVYDTSDDNFKIRGKFILTSPNGKEIWVSHSAHNITWQRIGSIAKAKLEYSLDNGMTYPYTITPSTDASKESFTWVVPDTITTQARVKITDISDSTVYDASDDNFVIRGGFTITSPNGRESWQVGSEENITWESFGNISRVKIEYSTDRGARWNVIEDSIPNRGVYLWKVPDAISSQCLIRVSDSSDPDAFDVSDNVFQIKGALILDSPNGGEEWDVGSPQEIRWERIGSIGYVKLEYSTNGFTDETATNLIIGSTPAGRLHYTWTIPDKIGDNIKVRISDSSDEAVFDVSDSKFKIKGAFNIKIPNGGEAWVVGKDYDIKWDTYGGIPNIRLAYSSDEGMNWATIVSAIPNVGSYLWKIPDVISSKCKVKVSDVNDSSVFDISDSDFKIQGDLIITSPNGGEKWVVGSQEVIQWERVGSITKVQLEYSNNGGKTFLPIAEPLPNSGSYTWDVPDAITTEALVRITDVDDVTVTDTSDDLFSIRGSLSITSPNGGEAWVVGNVYDITWQSKGTIPYVKLKYSYDGGSIWDLIVDSCENSGVYSWKVPDSVSSKVKVRVVDNLNEEIFDVSDDYFRIRCAFILHSPNGGEEYKVGRSYNIRWVNIGTIPDVKLQYSRDDFSTDVQTISAAVPNIGMYLWTIPDAVSDKVKVRVSDPNDKGAYDDSNNYFRIVPDFKVTSPNGGEVWKIGSKHNITWQCKGTVPQVKIEYSTDGGANFNIIAAAENTGSYSWIVPDSISDEFKVRVSDFSDARISDVSDSNATIKANFILNTPNGGEIMTVGDFYDITWDCVGTVENVRLDYSLDDFLTSVTITDSTPNNGRFRWKVPDAISMRVKVRVMSTTDVYSSDTSDYYFKIKGAFNLTVPNGGEYWEVDKGYNIMWDTRGTISNVKIVYSTDGGSTYPYTITASAPNKGYYLWKVADTPTSSARIKIIDVSDDTVYDESNSDFRIQGYLEITSPNGGEAWIVGSQQSIVWNGRGQIPYVKLSYSTDGGVTFPNVIADKAPNKAGDLGSYHYIWSVPDDISYTVRVKIEDTSDDMVYDISDGDFSIVGGFTIISPNGGERWVVKEDHLIKWETKGTIPSVKLQYSKDNFISDINTIIAFLDNTNSYNWSVPDDRSSTIKVRVMDAGEPEVYDDSDSNFTIDYYAVTFQVKDSLTDENLQEIVIEGSSDKGDLLQVSEGPLVRGASLGSPVTIELPYGYWRIVCSKGGYHDKEVSFKLDRDKKIEVYMEAAER
jgi:hypothetical protein